MKAFQFLFVAAFAAVALQAQAAEIPRSPDKVDLRLLFENANAVINIVFKHINAAVAEVKPNVDTVLNELSPELKAVLRKYIDEAKQDLKEEEDRFKFVITTLLKFLDHMKPIKSCADKVSPDLKKLSLSVQKQGVEIYNEVMKKFDKELTNIQAGINKTLEKARVLFDKEVPAIEKCLTPGRKDAAECVKKEAEKIVKEVSGIVLDIVMISQTSQKTTTAIINYVLPKALPLLEKIIAGAGPLIKALGDCVGTLSY